MSNPNIERLIDAFENAVLQMDSLGAIPVSSDDPEEMRAITAERRRIRSNYTHAKRKLLKAFQV